MYTVKKSHTQQSVTDGFDLFKYKSDFIKKNLRGNYDYYKKGQDCCKRLFIEGTIGKRFNG